MLRHTSFQSITLFWLLGLGEALVYFNSSASLPSNVSADCLNTLASDIACDASIRRLRPSVYYPQIVLQGLCTETCNTALNTWQEAITTSCDGQTYDSLTGAGYIPINIIPQQLRYAFNLSCLTDASSGQFCNVQAATAAGISADQTNLGKPERDTKQFDQRLTARSGPNCAGGR